MKKTIDLIIKKIINSKLEIFILFIIICFSFYRSPFIFINGRFVGEEATHHLMFALNNNIFSNLIYFDNVTGYYNLIPNLLSEIATYAPLEFAPLVTVYGSFIIIINLSIICLFQDSYFLDNKIKKIVATLLLFISPPFVTEIWVNSLNSQIYLCLTAILILFVKNLKNEKNIYLNLNVLIASLSGIYTCVLTPFFLIRFLYKKTKYNLINFIITLFSSIMQAYLILYSRFTNTLHEAKLELSLNSDHLILFIYNNFSKPIFGRQLTHLIYEKTNLILLITIIFLILVTFSYHMLKKENIDKFKKDFVLQFLILSFMIYSLVIIIGSVNTQLGGRYAVILGSIFLLTILRSISLFESKLLKIILISFLTTSIMTGIYEFRPPTKNVKHQYIKFLDCINCPVWKEEVQKWKKDQNYRLKLWPYPRKSLKLKIND